MTTPALRVIRNAKELGNLPRKPKHGHQAVCTTVLRPEGKGPLPDSMKEAHFRKKGERQDERKKEKQRIEYLVDPEEESDKASWQYFDKRRLGFVDVHRLLYKKDLLTVGLFSTVDKPRELVVIKKFTGYDGWETDENLDMPREFKFSTLQDCYPVSRHLWLGGELLPVAHTHAFAIRDFHPIDASFWSKYYNGPTLCDFASHHRIHHLKVPEIFIWHVIAELGRALAFLHMGTYRSRKYNIDRYMSLTDNDLWSRNIKAPTRRGWKPIAHFDNHSSNVWFHYPSAEEKAEDPRLERFSDELPQVILGDFGLAMTVDENLEEGLKKNVLASQKFEQWNIPEKFTWKDKCLLGECLKLLILSSRLHVNEKDDATSFDDTILDPEIIQTDADWVIRMLDGYSDHLQKVIHRFDPIKGLNNHPDEGRAPASWAGNKDTGYKHFTENVVNIIQHYQTEYDDTPWERDNWPTNDFVYGKMIAMADVRIARYHANKDDIGPIDDPVRPRSLLDTMSACYPHSKKERMLSNFDETDTDYIRNDGQPGREVKKQWPTGSHQFVTVQYNHVTETTLPELAPTEVQNPLTAPVEDGDPNDDNGGDPMDENEDNQSEDENDFDNSEMEYEMNSGYP